VGVRKGVRVGVRVGVPYSRNKLALRKGLRNLNLKSLFSTFYSFRDIRVHTYDFLKFVGGLWALKGACKLFLSQSIGSNTFQLFKHKKCRSHSFGRFVGVRVGVAPCLNKLALRKKLRNLHAKSQ